MQLRIEWKPRAIRETERLPERDRMRVIAAIERFGESHHGDVKKLTGVHPPEYRLRVGDFRVRFAVADGVMTVLHVLNRRDAY